MSARTLRVAVAGLGHWGPNIARNLDAIEGVEVGWLCDPDTDARSRAAAAHPRATVAAALEDALEDPTVEAVAVATPVPTHARAALSALGSGRHVLVEKPLASTVAEAEAVVEAARRADRTLMVGHLLEYHPGIERLAELVEGGELGEIRYVYSNRLNLGKLRSDENALWSLGAHDVAVLLRLVGEEPIEVAAHGESYVRPGVEDVVFCWLRFPSGISAHLHLSWLDPHKERRFTVVGERRMATFDDMRVEGKLTVYDKGFDEDVRSYGEYITRTGDIWSPRVPSLEPLRLECEEFVAAVRERRPPRSDGQSGLRVVRVLAALQESLDATRRGERVAAG